MPQLKALIFDVDGTLAETERNGHRVAFNRAFSVAGLPWHWSVEDYGQLLTVSGGKERIRAFIEQSHPNLLLQKDINQQIAQLHQAKTAYFKQLLQVGQIPLRPGVQRLLQTARENGIRLAIATTSALENAIALLETTLAPESPTWFDVIAAGDIVAAKKPAPDVYHYVLDQMALSPNHCLVFEDSQNGLEAAIQAQLKTVITVNHYTYKQDFSKAALVLSHLGEPTYPFNVIAGEAGGLTHFNLDLAHQILAMP
jgi:HAD superfamily hydrolase (TIGR01509 family)